MKKYAGHIILAVVIVILAVVIAGMYFNKQESTNLNNSVETSEHIAIDTPEPTAELTLEPIVEPATTLEPTSTPEPTPEQTPEPTPEAEEEKPRQSYITKTEDGYEYDFLLEFAGIIAGYYGVSKEDMIAYVETNIEELYNMEDDRQVDRALFEYADTLPSFIVPMDAIMYAQKSVNVRIGHSTDYDKIGSLTTNQEVVVTGQSSETGWYQIEFEGGVGYVSDAYLGPNMVEVPEADAATPGTNSGGNSDSSYISERNGYQVGDQMIIGMYTSVTYQGGDVWMTEDSRAYTVVKDNGNGYIEFAPGIFAKPGEQPVSERVGYQPGDTMLCHSLGYDFNRVYVGNDIWYSDLDPDTMLIASLQNGKLVFTTYDW